MRIKYLARISLEFSRRNFYIRIAMTMLKNISQAQLKNLQKLTIKKYRQSQGRFIIEGVHVVDEALRSDWNVEMILATDAFRLKEEFEKIGKSARERGVPTFRITDQALARVADTVTAQGILGVVEIKEASIGAPWAELPSQALLVALDSISDPGNLGTIVRTCDWFGVDAIVMSKNTVELYNPKVVRSSMGSLFHLPIATEVDLGRLVTEARREGVRIYATALTGGVPPSQVSFAGRVLIVFGSEAHGISANVAGDADEWITIPRIGKAESLNVSVTTGIVLGRIRGSAPSEK